MRTPASLSVIVRTCDRPLLLKRALCCLANQTRLPDEVVVVNDSSRTLQTDAIETGNDQLRLINISSDRRLGRAGALNAGIRASKGDWIAILDDDDTWDPKFIAQMLDCVEGDPGFKAVACQTTVILEEIGNGGAVTELAHSGLNPDFVAVDLLSLAAWNQFTINAVVFSRSVWETVGPFREDLPVLEDWEFNLRLAAHCEVIVIPHPLAHYRKRSSAPGALANTSADEHERVRHNLRNEWLREDLRLGRLGLGYLAALGAVQREVRRVHPLASAYERLRARWRRFRGYRL